MKKQPQVEDPSRNRDCALGASVATAPQSEEGPPEEAEASLRWYLALLEADMNAAGAGSASSTRERILDAAVEIFAARGFRYTTMRDLASAVGIKAPGLYAHFVSKEDILARAMLRAIAGFLNFMTAPADCDTAEDLLRVTVQRHVRYQLGYRSTTRANDLLLASEDLADFLPPSDFDRLRDVQRAYYRTVRTRIEAAVPNGSDVEPGVTAFALINLCDLVTSWYQPDGSMTIDEVADYYWFLACGMLRL